MKVNVHAVNFLLEASRFCSERMDKLEKYYDNFFRCLFKVEKTSDKEIRLRK
jgi:hypothetical protein